MQLSKKTQRQASIAAISGLVIIGAASLFFKTYPHLNPFSCQSKKEQPGEKQDEPVDAADPKDEAAEEFSTVDTPESDPSTN